MVFEDLEWDPEYVPGVKLGLHAFQIIFAFIIFCLEIVVFKSGGSIIVGNNAWPFAVVFLSIPAWIFLVMTPRFERTRALAEPHAMLTVDAVFTVFWLSAFASQAAFNTANLCGEGCGASKAIVGLGIIVTLLFGGTTFLSIHTLKHYQFHGSLPGYDRQKIRGSGDNSIDPDKAAFSMAPHDEEAAYGNVPMDDRDDGYGSGARRHSMDHDEDRRYGSNSPNRYGSTSPGRYGATVDRPAAGPYDDDPNRYGSLPPRREDAVFDADTEYRRPSGGAPQTHYAPPTAQDDYDDERPAAFPAANYDRLPR